MVFRRYDDTTLVGEAAVPRGIAEPDRQARGFKRRMGDEVPILLGGMGFAAHELIGMVLRWTVDKVAELQGGAPEHVVLTHPAEWGDHRRGLLIEAAGSVGLRDVASLPSQSPPRPGMPRKNASSRARCVVRSTAADAPARGRLVAILVAVLIIGVVVAITVLR